VQTISAPEQDRLQIPPEPPANWSENVVCIFNAPDSGLAVYTHFCRISAERPTLWEGILAVFLPGEELLVSRSFAAARDDQVADAGGLRYTCVEPLSHWHLEFDGLVRRTRTDELAAGFLPDGPVEPLRIGLGVAGIRPAWSVGHAPDQPWGDFHLEQESRIEGSITVGGNEIAVSTLGLRDHSRGPRDHAGIPSEGWSFGFFPSGRSYVALHVGNDTGSDLVTGLYFDGQATHEITRVEVPLLHSPLGDPREYEVRLGGDSFGDLVVLGHLDGAAPFTLGHPIGQPIGFDGSDRGATLLVEGPATPVLDGETGHGWLERVARSANLRTLDGTQGGAGPAQAVSR
jgi:hypothetical protein